MFHFPFGIAPTLSYQHQSWHSKCLPTYWALKEDYVRDSPPLILWNWSCILCVCSYICICIRQIDLNCDLASIFSHYDSSQFSHKPQIFARQSELNEDITTWSIRSLPRLFCIGSSWGKSDHKCGFFHTAFPSHNLVLVVDIIFSCVFMSTYSHRSKYCDSIDVCISICVSIYMILRTGEGRGEGAVSARWTIADTVKADVRSRG